MKPSLRAFCNTFSAMKPLRRNLEIESKFIPTAQSLSQLRANSGLPPFNSLRPLGTTRFHDEYFDRDALLERQGIWIRKRNGTLEAKTRTAGNAIHSTFEEVIGEDGVAMVVRGAGKAAGQKMQLHDLDCTASFTTTREAWLADKRFHVVVDEADFGHCVGEVEVVNGDVLPDAKMQEVLRADLRHFMAKYWWAFPNEGQKPVAKLAAYLARFPPK